MGNTNTNYKHNTPTFNTKNKRVDNFKDFTQNLPEEEKELKDVKRSFRHEQGEVGNIPNKSKYKFNKVTHKMDDLSKAEVQDKLNAIEEGKQRRINEWVRMGDESEIQLKLARELAESAAYEFCEDQQHVEKGFETWWTAKINEISERVKSSN